MSSALVVNFWADYIEQLKCQLRVSGMQLDGTESDEDLFVAFFNHHERRIQPKARHVHIAAGMQAPADLTQAFSAIQQEIENGADLTPRTSRRLKSWLATDPLLAEWGIQHLHFGNHFEADGFIERSGPVLFVRFETDNAFVIAVRPHGNWEDQELIEILHTNWPATIAKFRLEVQGLDFVLTAEERKNFRRNGINAPVRLRDGTVYGSLGGGISSDGTPINVSIRLANARRTLRKGEQLVRKELATTGISSAAGAKKISLVLQGTHAFAIDESGAVKIPIW
jgi:hypothetical protein